MNRKKFMILREKEEYNIGAPNCKVFFAASNCEFLPYCNRDIVLFFTASYVVIVLST